MNLTFNLYDKLKDKSKKLYRESNYIDEVINILISMFEYENIPQATNNVVIETYLHSGACCIDKNGKAWACTPKGKLKDNFEFDEVIGIDNIGNTFNGKNGVDCVVGYNNITKTPNTFISKFAFDMSQIDLSMECNLRYARMNKGFRVSTEKEKLVLEQALEKANNGESAIFISNNISNLLENTSAESSTFNLTDVDKIDRLQYLSNFREDTLKNFWRKYGINMNGFTKLAQQSIDEVNDGDIFSMLLPNVMLKCRQEFCEKVNNLFGFNMSVKFSKLWETEQKEANTLQNEMEEPTTEPTEEKGANNENNED